jgi:hypothetical protein
MFGDKQPDWVPHSSGHEDRAIRKCGAFYVGRYMPNREDVLPPFSGWKTVTRVVYIPKYTVSHRMTRARYICLQCFNSHCKTTVLYIKDIFETSVPTSNKTPNVGYKYLSSNVA